MNLDIDNLFKPSANVLISEYWSDAKDKKSTILTVNKNKKLLEDRIKTVEKKLYRVIFGLEKCSLRKIAIFSEKSCFWGCKSIFLYLLISNMIINVANDTLDH